MKIIVIFLLLCGCAVSITPQSAGGSRADGVIEYSYEKNSFQRPNVDYYSVQIDAIRRCEAWGYATAEPFSLNDQNCIGVLDSGGCVRWEITLRYQCGS